MQTTNNSLLFINDIITFFYVSKVILIFYSQYCIHLRFKEITFNFFNSCIFGEIWGSGQCVNIMLNFKFVNFVFIYKILLPIIWVKNNLIFILIDFPVNTSSSVKKNKIKFLKKIVTVKLNSTWCQKNNQQQLNRRVFLRKIFLN